MDPFHTPPLEVTHLKLKSGCSVAFRVINKDASLPKLIMVQGLSGIVNDWGDLPMALAYSDPNNQREVLVFDNIGMGLSSAPNRDYSVDEFMDAVISLADYLKYDAFDLLGISMGGAIAQWVTIHHPHRVRRLILGCTLVDPAGVHEEALQHFIEQAQGTDKVTNPREAKRLVTEKTLVLNLTEDFAKKNPLQFARLVDRSLSGRRSARGFRGQLNSLQRFDTSEEVAKIKQPTLIIHCENDRVVKYDCALQLKKLIPNSRLVTLKGVGHMFWVDGLETTRVEVLKFLTSSSKL